MNKISITLALLLVISITNVAVAETFRITFATGETLILPAVRHIKQTLIPTIDKYLAENGQHKIIWNQAYGGTLAKPGHVLEAIESGVADMGMVANLLEASKLPLQNVQFLAPFGSIDLAIAMDITNTLHKNIPAMRKSWEKHNQVYICAIATDSFQLFTKFPVHRVEDIKDKKIGGGGPNLNWLRNSGAVAVTVKLFSLYNELKTGVEDGVIMPTTAGMGAKLFEVAPYVTKVNFGAFTPAAITINKDVWNKLPDEVKNAIRTSADTYSLAYVNELKMRVNKAYQIMQSQGAIISTLSEDERVRWANIIPNIAKQWSAELDNKGIPATMVLRAYLHEVTKRQITMPRDWLR